MDGTGDLFDPFLSRLDQAIPVTVVRYLARQTLGLAESLAIAQAALPREGPFVLLGDSFSGPLAMAVAASRLTGLVGLVLCCSFARNPWPSFLGTLLRPLVGWLAMARMPLGPLSRLLLGRFETPALRAALERAMASVSSEVLQARLDIILTNDATASLAAVQVPVLYLQARHDRIVPASAAELIRRVRPDVRALVFDAPHGLLQCVPVEAAREIEAFIVAVETGSLRLAGDGTRTP